MIKHAKRHGLNVENTLDSIDETHIDPPDWWLSQLSNVERVTLSDKRLEIKIVSKMNSISLELLK
jgi:hypothetical protein